MLSSQSHSHSKETGRNMMQLVNQWEVGGGGGGPLWEIIGVVSGVQFSTDFLTDMTDSTLSIHFFKWLFLPYSLAQLFFYPPCSWSTGHCFLRTLHFLKRLHLIRACIRLPPAPCDSKYGGLSHSAATVMSTYTSAPSVRKKSFARSSKPSVRMCIREQSM